MTITKNKNKKLITVALIYFMGMFLFGQNLLIKEYSTVQCGAQQFEKYLPFLKGKNVAVVTNQTGVVGNKSIVDTLLTLKVKIKKIFGPEHGFRGNTEAGTKVSSNKDAKTGLPIISLYGSNKKPTKEQLKGIDIVVYDIQDVGVRFYTYISTMCYVMEACAENNIEMIVLDRPNPNGFYVDGPVMQNELKGFLGLHNIPVVYGMTCGEYAKMANEEEWLTNKVKCNLKIIPCVNYDRNATYILPIHPSPNLPNIESVLLYPGIGLFEGTEMSVGRGTKFPFQVIGHPNYSDTGFYFIPKPNELSKTPKHVNKKCYGINLLDDEYLKNHPKKIALKFLLNTYKNMQGQTFFNNGFNAHSGNGKLMQQIKDGLSENEIRKTWEDEIKTFLQIRQKHLIYTDFN